MEAKVKMAIAFEVSTFIPATPSVVYRAWLNSEEHAAMTGGAANVNAEVGGSFEAWDGYIQGVNLELEADRRILQSWRTTEFAEDDPNSFIEVLLERVEGGTQLTLRHTNLPDHGLQYRQGWVESYFEPMQAYFSAK
jgi:uncharacterized protein YndB with AHSA1/START domain